MARDGIPKVIKNAVWENASRWSGEHKRAGQRNNVRSLPCTEIWKYPRKHFLALRKW